MKYSQFKWQITFIVKNHYDTKNKGSKKLNLILWFLSWENVKTLPVAVRFFLYFYTFSIFLKNRLIKLSKIMKKNFFATSYIFNNFWLSKIFISHSSSHTIFFGINFSDNLDIKIFDKSETQLSNLFLKIDQRNPFLIEFFPNRFLLWNWF